MVWKPVWWTKRNGGFSNKHHPSQVSQAYWNFLWLALGREVCSVHLLVSQHVFTTQKLQDAASMEIRDSPAQSVVPTQLR